MIGFERCNLCARHCFVNRTKGQIGYCGASDTMHICRADLHMWEEPVISGTRGSGTIFFSSCSLKCVYCQNYKISRSQTGKSISESSLAQIMMELENKGAHNINLVTPTHYVPGIIKAIDIARSLGLNIPIVYNTSSYDTEETLKALDGYVDVYLPDLKYVNKRFAKEYSSAENYPDVAKRAISQMFNQRPLLKFDSNGILKSGVVARVLLLPGHVANSKLCVKYLYESFGDNIYISLMSQYTPLNNLKSPLDRKVTREEYRELVEYAKKIGVKNAFIQEIESAKECFIPAFIK